MAGNVCEWVEDTFAESYADHPTDGSAYKGPDDRKICRGGGANNATLLHTFDRIDQRDVQGLSDVGFRVANE